MNTQIANDFFYRLLLLIKKYSLQSCLSINRIQIAWVYEDTMILVFDVYLQHAILIIKISHVSCIL